MVIISTSATIQICLTDIFLCFQPCSEMSEEERAKMAEKFADMDDYAYEMYMEELTNEVYEQSAMAWARAYSMSYGGSSESYGNRKLNNADVADVCVSCEESCEEGHTDMDRDEEEFYKELQEMLRNGVCEQVDEYYIGPTCGADGLTIELAVYSDEDCTTMVPVSAYGYMENVGMGDYMNTLLDLYTKPFSCSMGMQMNFVAAYEKNVCIICVHLGISFIRAILLENLLTLFLILISFHLIIPERKLCRSF